MAGLQRSSQPMTRGAQRQSAARNRIGVPRTNAVRANSLASSANRARCLVTQNAKSASQQKISAAEGIASNAIPSNYAPVRAFVKGDFWHRPKNAQKPQPMAMRK